MRALGERTEFRCSTYGMVEEGVHHFRGGKWAGLYDFFRQNPDLLHAYDYFWFPDDDIETIAGIASAFLSLCAEEGFELAQPALTPDSYFAYRETIVNPRFRFRRTNFVELMMPLMRREFLLRVLPLFDGRHAALGIDWVWQEAAVRPLENVAVVDAYPMSHTRPRNRYLASKMREQDINLAEERSRTFAMYDIQPIVPIVYGGRLKNGVETGNRLRLAAELLLGYEKIRRKVENGAWTARHTVKLVVRQLRAASSNACPTPDFSSRFSLNAVELPRQLGQEKDGSQ